MKLLTRYGSTILLAVLTPVLLLFALFFTGGGHRFWHLYVLPWAMIGTVFGNTINFIFIVTGILQFPLYGFLLDRSRKEKLVVVFSILVLQHTVLAIVLLLTRSQNWIP